MLKKRQLKHLNDDERKRHLQDIDAAKSQKSNLDANERERKPSLFKIGKKLMKPRKIELSKPKVLKVQTGTGDARERHHFKQAFTAKPPELIPVSSLLSKGLRDIRKSTQESDGAETRSNKHVDINAKSTNTHDQDMFIQCNDKDHIPTDQIKSVNTNLMTEVKLPTFLTKKSAIQSASVQPAFCDKFSATFDLKDPDIEYLMLKARSLGEVSGSQHYKLLSLSGAKHYRHTYRLVDCQGAHVALLQFSPSHRSAKFARIELNPMEIGDKGLAETKRVLKGLFGQNFREYLGSGTFTRLDATLDIHKIRPSDILIFSDRARDSSLWVRRFNRKGFKEWETETVTLGSPNSDYFAEVYDKGAQLWRVKGQDIASLMTRIEIRMKPRDSQGASLPVHAIRQARNPFGTIYTAYYPGPDKEDFLFNFFICAANYYGAEEALGMIRDRNVRSRYWNLLLDHEPEWWNPELAWAQVLQALKATGLFPDSVFD